MPNNGNQGLPNQFFRWLSMNVHSFLDGLGRNCSQKDSFSINLGTIGAQCECNSD